MAREKQKLFPDEAQKFVTKILKAAAVEDDPTGFIGECIQWKYLWDKECLTRRQKE